MTILNISETIYLMKKVLNKNSFVLNDDIFMPDIQVPEILKLPMFCSILHFWHKSILIIILHAKLLKE